MCITVAPPLRLCAQSLNCTVLIWFSIHRWLRQNEKAFCTGGQEMSNPGERTGPSRSPSSTVGRGASSDDSEPASFIHRSMYARRPLTRLALALLLVGVLVGSVATLWSHSGSWRMAASQIVVRENVLLAYRAACCACVLATLWVMLADPSPFGERARHCLLCCTLTVA
jgi:hypothetical protein